MATARALRSACAVGALLFDLQLASGAAHAAAPEATTLDTLVAAERAFSALSVERGMKEAFLTYLAGDAIVFRPGPTSGKEVWTSRPSPAGVLAWAPDYAEISGAGDLGVTSGPWEYGTARGQASACGHFVSVWRRTTNGPWRVAVDIGIRHEPPDVGLDAVELVRGPEHPKTPPPEPDFGSVIFGGPGLNRGFDFAAGPGYVPLGDRLTARAITDMMTAERSLVFITRNRGIEEAYRQLAAADVRVYREGHLPMVGLGEAMSPLSQRGRRVELAPDRHAIASSRDLGYSVGLLIVRKSADAPPDTVSYLHVWRHEGEGHWKLAVDVENAFVRRK